MKHTDEDKALAFREGQEAAWAGDALEANPYTDELARIWLDGYGLEQAGTHPDDITSWMEHTPAAAHDDIDLWPYEIPW